MEAGAPEDKAQAAAEEIAEFENRLSSIERRLSRLEIMVSINMALTVAILVKLFVT